MTPPLPLLRPCTTTLPVLPLGSSRVKVFPTASLGGLPVLLAGRKSPAHGATPPLRAGSAKSAAVPAVLVPSEDRSVAGLRKVAIYGNTIPDRARTRYANHATMRLRCSDESP